MRLPQATYGHDDAAMHRLYRLSEPALIPIRNKAHAKAVQVVVLEWEAGDHTPWGGLLNRHLERVSSELVSSELTSRNW